MKRRPRACGLALAAALIPLLAGCAAVRARAVPLLGPPAFTEEAFEQKRTPTYRISPPSRDGAAEETVIGAVRSHRIRDGETLLDVARYYDLGYNEVVEANPGLDPFIPPTGTEVVVPTEWVVPCCTYQGIVVNIPEMRLYYFRPAPGDPHARLVDTHPVGLGRDDRRTPRGKFRVATKSVNPRWNIPTSIRVEHMRERGDARRFIAGGEPDNPLGKYRLQLSRGIYSIHGTDIPWGVGMQVTHGCVRLYPEDIERLFPLVPVGTPVEFTYQPVKVGTRRGVLYVEAHRDIYRYTGSLGSAARVALGRQALDGRVDRRLLRAALDSAAGLPVRVSSDQVVARGQSTSGAR
jgi:L,D-transpeptidase ErfK/SrfK